MSGKNWIRQTHRWVSMAFTITVVINLAMIGQDEAARMRVAYLPLLPLALLLLTGLYLFVEPYVARRKRAGRAT
jgi:hypothetical protein